MLAHVRKHARNCSKLLAFVGPGFLISVGYVDPGNWATDLEAGSKFGYSLLFVILMSNCFALVMQYLCIKLGVITDMDLAQACRFYFPPKLSFVLWILAEIAMIATDLAEVIGSAIALNILFKIPTLWAVVLTGGDVVFVLLFYKAEGGLKSVRRFEMLIMVLVLIVGICFIVELVLSRPIASDVFAGFLPTSDLFSGRKAYVSLAIVGATLMPHNLYLHSHAVKIRASPAANVLSKISSILKFAFIDCAFALTFAFFINAAILIVSGTNFHYGEHKSTVADLYAAYNLLIRSPGQVAATTFAVALLLSGQSSCITATLAGSVVMEGFINLKLQPWLRRLVTRLMSMLPAIIVILLKGSEGLNELLVFSQVLLSLQLPFAVIPLVYFTSRTKWMKRAESIMLQQLPSYDVDNQVWDSSTPFPAFLVGDETDEDQENNRDPNRTSITLTIPSPKNGMSISASFDYKHRDTTSTENLLLGDHDSDHHHDIGSSSLQRQYNRQTGHVSSDALDVTTDYANSWMLTILASTIAGILLIMNIVLLVHMAAGNV